MLLRRAVATAALVLTSAVPSQASTVCGINVPPEFMVGPGRTPRCAIVNIDATYIPTVTDGFAVDVEVVGDISCSWGGKSAEGPVGAMPTTFVPYDTEVVIDVECVPLNTVLFCVYVSAQTSAVGWGKASATSQCSPLFASCTSTVSGDSHQCTDSDRGLGNLPYTCRKSVRPAAPTQPFSGSATCSVILV